MFGFGYNVFRQIDGSRNTESVGETTKIIDVPVKIDTSISSKIIKVESCWTNTFFLNENGNVDIFGWIPKTKSIGKAANFFPGETIQDISCAGNKVVFVTTEGKLLLWNDYMNDTLSPIVMKWEKSFSKISCGDLQTIVLTDDGHLGQVMIDTSPDGSKPTPSMLFVEIPFSNCVQTIGCGKEHTLILTKDGTVFSFGGGSRGQIGNGSLDQQDKPIPVEALSGITATMISCGGWHSAAISSSGDLYTWGWNKDGQVGVSYSDSLTQDFVQIQAVPFPVVFSDNNVVDISCGARHTAALTSNGELWTWGFGYYGQLGHGSRKSCYKPVKVSFTTSTTKAKSVYCNHWNSFVSVKND